MRHLLRGRFGTFLGGIIIGALGIWFLSVFVHIPGENTSHTAVTTYSSNTSSPQTQASATPGSSPNTSIDSHAAKTLPPVIPVYTPSSLQSSGDNKAIYTSQSPDYTVLNFYGEALSTNGWHITTESTENGSTTINASGNGYTISVSISAVGNNGSQFVLQLS